GRVGHLHPAVIRSLIGRLGTGGRLGPGGRLGRTHGPQVNAVGAGRGCAYHRMARVPTRQIGVALMSPTTPADLDHDRASERTHLIESRDAVAGMRRRAEEMYATGDRVAGDPFGAESLGRALARRIAELADDPSAPLFFGRLNFGLADADHAGHT